LGSWIEFKFRASRSGSPYTNQIDFFPVFSSLPQPYLSTRFHNTSPPDFTIPLHPIFLVQDINSLPCLSVVSLSCNSISFLEGMSGLPSLESLFLSNNSIDSIVGLPASAGLTAIRLQGSIGHLEMTPKPSCPRLLPSSLALVSCPHLLPSSLALVSCPRLLPSSLALVSCPHLLPN
jgi:hypothetical protein